MKLQDRLAFVFGRAGWTRLVAALALVTLAALAAPRAVDAAGYDVPWEWVQLKWDSTAAGVDKIHIGDEADTVRTRTHNTENWDWSAFDPTTTVKGVPVVFVATGIVAVADTVYFRTEICHSGKCTYGSRFEAPGLFNSAVNTGGGVTTATASNGLFWGYISVDFDARDGNNIWAARDFRLVVYGDQAGASPILTGVECWIKRPRKRS